MEVVGERGDMAYITAVWCARTGCGAPGLSAAVCDYCDRGGGVLPSETWVQVVGESDMIGVNNTRDEPWTGVSYIHPYRVCT